MEVHQETMEVYLWIGLWMDAHYPSLSVGSTDTKACQVDQKHFIATRDI
jgi:hypothetical protein